MVSFVGTVLGADSGYHIVARYALAAPGAVSVLAIDPAARELYVGDATGVEVLDTTSGRNLATIPAGARVEGIAVAPKSKRAFFLTTAGDVDIVDTSTFKIVQRVHGSSPGTGPRHMAYDSGTRRVFVADAGNSTVSALDGATGTPVGSVHLAAQPGEMISNGYGHLFVAVPARNRVHVLDTESLKDLGAFPSRYGEGCGGLALDPVGRRLFVACSNGVLNVIDTDIGFTFQQLRIGSGDGQAAFTFTPQGKGGWKGATFVASPDGTFTALKMNSYVSYSAGTQATVRPGIHGVAFDPQSHRVFVAAPVSGAVSKSSAADTPWEILAIAE